MAFSSSQIEEKKEKHKEKKIIEKKKMQRREGAYLQAPFLPFIFGSCSCLFVSSTFSWHFLLFKQKKKKEKHKEKQIHKKKKNCRKGRELTFKLHFYPFIFGSCFYPPAFTLSFQVLSPYIFFFSNRRKKTHTKKKKP
jgi:hypothetical protein